MRVQDHPGRTFAAALDAAIAARGLTLDRVRRHLADHGITVSVATLSYWRRDLRQPENARSRRAVAVLEESLELPPATLTGLIAAPRPRGRGASRPEQPPVAALLATLALPGEGRGILVSAHDVFTVRQDGTERGVRSRVVVRGVGGRVTRHVIRYQSDCPSSVPVLSDVDYASPGRVLTDRATGLVAAELLLDRPIACGEYAVVEYAIGSRPGLPVSHYSRTLPGTVSEYTQLIRFEGRPPAFCTSFWRADATAPAQRRKPVRMGLSRASTLVVRDGLPGIVGTEW